MAVSLLKCCVECNKQQINNRSVLKKIERIYRRNFKSDTRGQQSLASEVNIDIPQRIERSSVDILMALSSTVGKDFTAPHYKFHDDPFFIPLNSVRKTKYEMSKRIGREAAQYIKKTIPQYFARNDASPNVPQFNPKVCENTPESLLFNIMNGNVTEATNVYNALIADDQEIPENIQMSFLELLCFYNSSEPEEEDINIKAKWPSRRSTTTTKMWRSDSLAQRIFDKMKNKTPEAYCSMIKGMAKFSFNDGAYQLFQETKEKGFKVDLETYNALIPGIAIKDGIKNWDNIIDLLNQIQIDGIKPNIDTFNTLLEVIYEKQFKQSRNLTLSVIAEMKRLKIEPSLSSYYFVLANFYKETGSTHTILYSIMDVIEGKKFSLIHPKDALFFAKAMDVCANHLIDAELTYRINNLLNLGRNYDLFVSPLNAIVYYTRFFKILCTEDIDVLFKYYNKLVPNTYVPDKNIFKSILDSIDLNYAYHYIGQIWTDVVGFKLEHHELIIETLLSIMAKSLENEEFKNQFSEIAKDILKRIEVKESRTGRMIQLTGSMFTDMINIHLNSSRFEDAWAAFAIFRRWEHKIIKRFIDENCVTRLINDCIIREDREKAMELVRYGIETHPDEAENYLLKAVDNFHVDGVERRALESLIKKDPSPSTKSSYD